MLEILKHRFENFVGFGYSVLSGTFWVTLFVYLFSGIITSIFYMLWSIIVYPFVSLYTLINYKKISQACEDAEKYYKENGIRCNWCGMYHGNIDCPICHTPRDSFFDKLGKLIRGSAPTTTTAQEEDTDPTSLIVKGRTSASYTKDNTTYARQEGIRDKWGRIRCPYPKCHGQSTIVEVFGTTELRECKSCGHTFSYDYELQEDAQVLPNWRSNFYKGIA